MSPITWDRVFAIGSLLAPLMQGLLLGSLLQGIRICGTTFAGGPSDFDHRGQRGCSSEGYSVPDVRMGRRFVVPQPNLSVTGALLVTPVVIAYSAFAYWVSRENTPVRVGKLTRRTQRVLWFTGLYVSSLLAMTLATTLLRWLLMLIAGV